MPYPQTTRPTPGAPDLLSALLPLAREFGDGVWLGGYRDGTAPPFRTWLWTDGTNASNLNCGAYGCGPYYNGQPKCVTLEFELVCCGMGSCGDTRGNARLAHLPCLALIQNVSLQE